MYRCGECGEESYRYEPERYMHWCKVEVHPEQVVEVITEKPGQRFLDRVAELDKLYPNDEDFPTVLASSKYPTMTNTNTLKNVKEFHKAFECHVAPEPFIPDGPDTQLILTFAAKLLMFRNLFREFSKENTRSMRLSLATEEFMEEVVALANRDVKGLLDAYADKDYIDKGSILAFGLQDVFYEACERVHQSNLSKLVDGKPIKDESGKVKKPPTYKPVDLTDLVDGTWLAAEASRKEF